MPASSNRIGVRTIMIWGTAFAAALWLAATAIGGVTKETSPRAALAMFPQNGFAYERSAAANALDASASIKDVRVSDADLASAREALRREPFATTALTIVGLSRELHGAPADAEKIVAAAHALDKRQLIANAWLINRYGMAGRDRDALSLLDEALKIQPQLTEQYMGALAQALQNPDTIPVFQALLRNGPAWEKDFWNAVAARDAALPNAEVLRARILAAPKALDEVDTQLMAAFIRAGRMDLAMSYAKSLPTLPEDRDNLVRNSSFSQMPLLPPLDWELTNDGRLSAAIDEGRGTLAISALPGSGGVIARQLVALPPGNYALLIKLGQASLARGSDITAHLRCAETGIASAVLNERFVGDLDRPFTVSDGGCRFYWLSLEFSALDASAPARASIAEVRIARGIAAPQE